MTTSCFDPSPALDAVLFDLDNTLCATDHLDDIRMRGDLNHLTPHLPSLCAVPGVEALLAEMSRVLPIGVVSRTHRWYLDAVLSRLFPSVRWATTVSYDDVAEQKPHPESLLLAAANLGVADRSRVAYLGDSWSDVEAAYHAGMRQVLCTWASPQKEVARGRALIPDAVLWRPDQVLGYASEPEAYLPHLEARRAGLAAPAGTRRAVTVDRLAAAGPLRIDVLGRYFTDNGPTAHLHGAHELSLWIEHKDEPGRFERPGVVSAVAEAVGDLIARHDIQLVTVIPAKPDRTPRMEQLLARLEEAYHESGGFACSFVPDMFYFLDDAQTIKLFSQDQRREEVNRSLHLALPCGQTRALVLDDVLTSGGTFTRARELLLGSGATYVHGLALAKTISGYRFHCDPTYRECPRCGRQAKLFPARAGGRFWGCVGFRAPDPCRWTEDA